MGCKTDCRGADDVSAKTAVYTGNDTCGIPWQQPVAEVISVAFQVPFFSPCIRLRECVLYTIHAIRSHLLSYNVLLCAAHLHGIFSCLGYLCEDRVSLCITLINFASHFSFILFTVVGKFTICPPPSPIPFRSHRAGNLP